MIRRSSPKSSNPPVKLSSMVKNHFHSLHLGDSYTIGESVPRDQNWPRQLSHQLSKNWGLITQSTIIAQTGWTTQDLLDALTMANINREFDLVSLMIGVNNQYLGLSLNDFQRDIRLLLDKSITYAGGEPSHVMVLSIPDWGITPYGHDHDPSHIRSMVDAFNRIIQNMTRDFGSCWIDITGISRNATSNPEMLASDQLHPSTRLYTVWLELILPAARIILTGNR